MDVKKVDVKKKVPEIADIGDFMNDLKNGGLFSETGVKCENLKRTLKVLSDQFVMCGISCPHGPECLAKLYAQVKDKEKFSVPLTEVMNGLSEIRAEVEKTKAKEETPLK